MKGSKTVGKTTNPRCRRRYLHRCMECGAERQIWIHPRHAGPSGIEIGCPECDEITRHALTNHIDFGRVEENGS